MSNLIVRKDHVLCTRCHRVIPVHPGGGTPLRTFVMALENLDVQHRTCVSEFRKKEAR